MYTLTKRGPIPKIRYDDPSAGVNQCPYNHRGLANRLRRCDHPNYASDSGPAMPVRPSDEVGNLPASQAIAESAEQTEVPVFNDMGELNLRDEFVTHMAGLIDSSWSPEASTAPMRAWCDCVYTTGHRTYLR